MSTKSAKEFLERLKQDKALREKLHAVKDREERLSIARDMGFDFTHEEWKEMSSDELTPEDLNLVAGGGCGDDGMACP